MEYDWPQYEKWAMDILDKTAPLAWVIPQTYSMRQALDNLWVSGKCEKSWVGSKNAYRLPASPTKEPRE